MRKIGMVCCLLLLFLLPAAAEETDWVGTQLEESGANDLWEALTPDTRALYHAVGVDSLAELGTLSLTPDMLLDITAESLAGGLRRPLAVTGTLLAAIVLCAYFGGMRETVSEEGMQTVYGSVSVLAVSTAVLLPFSECIRTVRDALSGASVFMGSFSPVYLALLTAGGQLRAAASYQTVLLLFSQVLTWLADGVLLPLLLSALAMGMVSAASDTGNFGKIGEMLLRGVSWILGILATVFTTLLSVNSLLGAAGETLGSKMIKVSIQSFVPVVGGAVSEALLTMKSCVGIVKSTVGAFGILTTALLLLPALLQCACWLCCLWICQTAAEVFENAVLVRLLKTVMTVTKTMTAALTASGMFMIVATAVVMLAGRGSA